MNIYPLGTLITPRYEVASYPMMGGMGIVYFCIDREEDQPVALKSFRPEFLPDSATRERFLQEGTIWIELGKHPHIVQCHGVVRSIDGTDVFLVLEQIPKEKSKETASLRSWLIPGYSLNSDHAIAFALQIALGLKYATNIVPGLVHRDLKPENILVGADRVADTEINRVRVSDFGLTAIFEQGQLSKKITVSDTKTTGLVGTPLYMAPEQLAGETASSKTDIYGLGCILYEMLTGFPILNPGSIQEILEAHRIGKLRPMPSNLPSSIKLMISQCLDPNPKNRYSSWSELETELKQIYLGITGNQFPTVDLQTSNREDRISNAWAYTDLGVAYLALSNVVKAEEVFNKARQIGISEKERKLESAVLNQLGITYREKGDLKKSIEYFQNGLKIDQENKDLKGQVACLSNLILSYVTLGDMKQAITIGEHALEVSRDIKAISSESAILDNLGVAYLRSGNYQEAIKFSEQSFDIAKSLGSKLRMANALGTLGNAYRNLRIFDKAIAVYTNRLLLCREIADLRGEANALMGIGNVNLDQNEPNNAIAYLEQSLKLQHHLGQTQNEAIAQMNLAGAFLKLNKLEEAEQYLNAAMGKFGEIGDKLSEAGARLNLASVHIARGRLDDALKLAQEADFYYRSIQHENYQTRSQMMIAVINKLKSSQGL